MTTNRVHRRPVPAALECTLGTAFNAAGQSASPGAVTISVVALCHWQRVQGGDQFYHQP